MVRDVISSAIVCLTMAALPVSAQCTAPTCSKIIDNGPDSAKLVMVVVGDGYTAAEQAGYDEDVRRLVADGAFGHDFFAENQNAFNAYRLNLISAESGVSQRRWDENGTPEDPSDDTIVSTTMKDTALRIIWSGSWAHCWLEPTDETWSRLWDALRVSVPHFDYLVVLLNEDSSGGCGGGGFQIVPRGVEWPLLSHEFGHGIGALWDEYAPSGKYLGGPVNNRNCSTVLDRDLVFWSRFVDPATPVPTTFGPGMDRNRTVGEFEGCAGKATGIYRPVRNCRMRLNTPEFCPVCHFLMRKILIAKLGHDFSHAMTGDFDGDGRDDLLIHNGGDLTIYRQAPSRHGLEHWWTTNNLVPAATGGNTWQPAPNDRYYVGDFNGDGRDDVLAFNGKDWIRPYLAVLRAGEDGLLGAARYDGAIAGFWWMAPDDQHFIGDFDGDGADDFIVFNGSNWTTPFLGLVSSNGGTLSGVVRYAGGLPGWTMRSRDRFYVGDFDADGKDDLYVWNGDDWPGRYLGMIRSSGTALDRIKLFANALPGWTAASGDQFLVGDFDGDGGDDLYVWNGSNWAHAFLLMLRSTGNDLAFVHRYDSSSSAVTTPGWALGRGDRFFIADSDRDGKDDLLVYNPAIDWNTEYLGTLRSTGTELEGSWSADWVGGWDLGPADKILVADYQGSGSRSDLYLRTDSWLGLLRRAPGGLVVDRLYHRWVDNALYDGKPHSAGVAAGRGTSSQPQEPQSNARPVAPSELPEMPETEPEQEPAQPAVEEPTAVAGTSQPAIDPAPVGKPQQGEGEQQPRPAATVAAAAPPSGSYLHLVLRVSEDGAAEVLSATEIAGEPLMSDEVIGGFVYRVELGGETVSAQSLPDPFELRSFPGPEGTPEGHHFGRAEAAAVVVKVPKADAVKRDPERLNITLFRLKPEASRETLEGGVQGLALAREAELVSKLDGRILAPAIRKLMAPDSPQ
ncbi:MAG: hypothetical protein GY856_07000 [bacterium]|nr:hypothetical protein [bacterium]